MPRSTSQVKNCSRISPAKKSRALSQLLQGRSIREVASSVGISIGSVIGIRNKNKGNIPDRGRGRPCKISPVTKRILARQFRIGQLKSLRDGQQFILERDGEHVQTETVRKYLRQAGLRAYVQPKKRYARARRAQKRQYYYSDAEHRRHLPRRT